MGIMEFLNAIREAILPILELIEKGKHEESFKLYREQVGAINGFVMFLDENHVVSEADLQQMLTILVQALENEDLFLLEDVLRYAILDIISQLEGGDQSE